MVGSQKRKTYIIDRAFQYRLIGMFLLSIIIALILFSAGTVFYYWASSMAGDNLFKEFIDINKQVYELEEGEDGKMVQVSKTRTVYGVKRWEIIVPPILINNLFMLILVSVLGLIYSHRIAGPAFRINRELRRVLDGEPGVQIVLRKQDQFRDLAGRINEVLTELDRVRQQLEKLE
ncbi:MAG: hypothetical protein HN368_12405 [Spirochaetales bacterium]|jgi:hypothetical protein|nr:hypothetical protein [Spirochaetales bacterium]